MPRRQTSGSIDHERATSTSTLRAVETALLDLGIRAGHIGDAGPVNFYRSLISTFFDVLFAQLDGSPLDIDVPPTINDACALLVDEWSRESVDLADGLGGVYQHLLTLQPVQDSPPFRVGVGQGAGFTLKPTRRNARKSSGSYYTPAALIDRLLDDVLDPVLDRAATADNLLAVKICDPACGSGLFLVAAARRVAGRLTALGHCGNSIADTICHCVHGFDIDPIAVKLCRFVLSREAEGLAPANVDCRDTLLDPIPSPLSLEGSGVGGEGFDVVVGNPPWLSLSGRQRVELPVGIADALIERYPEMTAWPSTHGAFLLMASGLVRDGGRFGFVLPLPVAYLDGYAGVRAAVGRNVKSVRVVDAGEEAFGQVTQATGLFSFEVCSRGEKAEDGSRWSITGGVAIVDEPPPFASRLDALPSFPAGTFGDPGVHTGNMSKELILDGSLADGGRYRLVREGRDIGPYRCGAPRLVVDTRPTLAGGQYCRIRAEQRFLGVPILLRQTGDRPIAARHVDPAYFRNSILACAGLPDVSVEVLLAVLNSDLIAGWYRARFCDSTQRSFPQIKVRNLQAMPIFDPCEMESTFAEIVDLVRVREQLDCAVNDRIEELVRHLYRCEGL